MVSLNLTSKLFLLLMWNLFLELLLSSFAISLVDWTFYWLVFWVCFWNSMHIKCLLNCPLVLVLLIVRNLLLKFLIELVGNLRILEAIKDTLDSKDWKKGKGGDYFSKSHSVWVLCMRVEWYTLGVVISYCFPLIVCYFLGIFLCELSWCLMTKNNLETTKMAHDYSRVK